MQRIITRDQFQDQVLNREDRNAGDKRENALQGGGLGCHGPKPRRFARCCCFIRDMCGIRPAYAKGRKVSLAA